MKTLSDGSKVILYFRGIYLWFFRWKEEGGKIKPLQKGTADELVDSMESVGIGITELEGVSIVQVPETIQRFTY